MEREFSSKIDTNYVSRSGQNRIGPDRGEAMPIEMPYAAPLAVAIAAVLSAFGRSCNRV
jgi:hypothetical protein